MIKFIVRRIILIIPVLIGAIIIVFTINYFSSANPAMIKLGLAASDPAKLAAMEHAMGLDQSYFSQLGSYLWDMFHGDLGESYVYDKTVSELIAERIPNTLRMSIGAMILSVLVGIPLGLVAALRQNTAVDYVTTGFAILMNAIPSFLIAVVLMIVFSVHFGWFPVSGADSWRSFVLPVIAAGIGPITQNARMTRSSVLEVIRQDYVRTARAKGISENRVTSRHIMKNALIPVITLIGTGLGTCLAGSILVEMIFNIPGMGMLINSSIMSQDYITVQGCVLVCAVVVTLMNLLTDLAYGVVDPQIRARYAVGSGKRSKRAMAKAEVV
ncbi:MAG: ABC transporter permease [Clostridiales Family XIII bacterium]|jgi:peptide/nickel transport system permease protein|nr:ABC transporter permease [Clostridiales Family XIII bacterium]